MKRFTSTHLVSLSIALTLLLPAAAVAGDEGDLRLELQESSLGLEGDLHVGDEVVYQVVIHHSPELSVDLTSPPEGSRWREVRREVTSPASGELHGQIHYVVLRPGPTVGPPIIARAMAHETDPLELELPGHPLEVIPLTQAGDPLDPARGPRELLRAIPLAPIAGGGAAALLALALIGLLLARRGREATPQAPPRPPHEIALEELDALRASPLVAEEAWKDYYLRLSEILRRYLGRRWGFPGTELTTTEIAETLSALELPDDGPAPEEIVAWLRACDRVKFAGASSTPELARDHLQSARAFVELSIPAPDPGAEGDSQEAAP